MYATATRSAWTQNPLVERELYQRMTGQAGFWLEWVFLNLLPCPAKKVLAIGCGDGAHEIMIAQRGFSNHVTAFDASPVAIEKANTLALAGGLNAEFEVKTFEEFAAETDNIGAYDVVLFSGSLHHVTDLEGMLSRVRAVLALDGRVVVNEYVGPCYQLYSKRQLGIINRFLDAMEPQFKLAPDIQLTLPTIEMIMAADPTEGVRSTVIPTLVPMYFASVYEKNVGGGLLHPIFGCLNGSKINDGSPESITLTRMLIAAENELTAAGILAHEFMFGVYKHL